MSRARNIKPGFFRNEELVECQPLARILFAGLWCEADREGRMEDRPKRIKVDVLPYDDCDVDGLLSQLASKGFIQRYEASGRRYIQVNNFTKHQTPHYKEVASVIPAPDGHVDSGVIAFGVSEADRQRIFNRDGRHCVACGSEERLSLDHIIPRSKGGTDADDNLRTLCHRCNTSKGNREAKADVDATSVQDQADIGSSTSLHDPLIPLTLIPDSLIPDSLIPDSLIPDSSEEKTYVAPNGAAHVDLLIESHADPPEKPLPMNGPAQEIVAAFCRCAGIAEPAVYAKAVGQAAKLVKAGVTAADVPSLFAAANWGDGVDLGKMLGSVDRWRAAKKAPPPRSVKYPEPIQRRIDNWTTERLNLGEPILPYPAAVQTLIADWDAAEQRGTP